LLVFISLLPPVAGKAFDDQFNNQVFYIKKQMGKKQGLFEMLFVEDIII